MLSNFAGGLSTQTIHNLLKYSPDRRPMDQLSALLGRLQEEGLVEEMDGLWRLV